MASSPLPASAVAQMFGDYPATDDLILHDQHGSWEIRIAGVYHSATIAMAGA
jgi:hypothetical protein